MTHTPANRCVNSVSIKFSSMYVSSSEIILALFYVLVHVFGVYPHLDLVYLLYTPPLVVQECLTLVVMANFLSVPPLYVHQVCPGKLSMGFPFVSFIPTVLNQLFKWCLKIWMY